MEFCCGGVGLGYLAVCGSVECGGSVVEGGKEGGGGGGGLGREAVGVYSGIVYTSTSAVDYR